MIWIFIGIGGLSLFIAMRSMKDFHMPQELTRLLKGTRIHGTIVFFKEKIRHYSSSSSS